MGDWKGPGVRPAGLAGVTGAGCRTGTGSRVSNSGILTGSSRFGGACVVISCNSRTRGKSLTSGEICRLLIRSGISNSRLSNSLFSASRIRSSISFCEMTGKRVPGAISLGKSIPPIIPPITPRRTADFTRFSIALWIASIARSITSRTPERSVIRSTSIPGSWVVRIPPT